jgi:hypothetical protein
MFAFDRDVLTKEKVKLEALVLSLKFELETVN